MPPCQRVVVPFFTDLETRTRPGPDPSPAPGVIRSKVCETIPPRVGCRKHVPRTDPTLGDRPRDRSTAAGICFALELPLITFELLKSVALVMLVCLGHGLILARWSHGQVMGRVAMGVLFGCACLLTMSDPSELYPGVIVDARRVVLTVSGVFGGPVAAAITAAMAGGYRLSMGGAGAFAGTAAILVCAVAGAVFHEGVRRGRLRVTWRSLLALAVAVNLGADLLAFWLLPPEGTAALVVGFLGPMLLVFIPGTVALGLILQAIERQNGHRLALEASEQRFRDLAEISSDWFWEMDGALKFSYISDRHYDITGFRREDRLGTSRDAYRMDAETSHQRAAWDAHLQDLAARRPFRDFQYTLKTPSGRRIELSISGVPVFDSRGRFSGYRGVGTDISGRKRRELEILRAKEQAETASKTKTAFLAHMSHELRTPLNSIIGFAELIQRQIHGPVGSDRYQEYLGDILASSRHLLGVIGDILDISKIETGNLALEERSIDVTALLESCRRLVAERALVRGITLTVQNQAGRSILLGDELRIKQVLLNLLTNAIKFSQPGDTVTMTARLAEDGGLDLAVIDQGPGIAAEDLPRILEPFGQARGSHIESHEGVGLGLPIAKAYVEAHGGRLIIDSVIGQGTRVTLTLPKARVEATTDREAEDDGASTERIAG